MKLKSLVRATLVLALGLALGLPLCHGSHLGGMRPFGTGASQSKLNRTEQTLFAWDCSKDCVMTHFWAAGSPEADQAIFRYYIDNETAPSIEFTPALACGVGFDDQAAPWGTKWMGKGAKSTGWFHNFRIPFSSIRITYQLSPDSPKDGEIWTIVRGTEGMSNGFKIGDVLLPPSSRLKLFETNKKLDPLEFIDLVDVQGAGMLFMSTMQVQSQKNFNFMEGCFHYYDHGYTDFPGMILSTGMEDYYDSAFYFNGGGFHAPVAGSTHKTQVGNTTQWSGYRFHEMDPIVFTNGMRFQWRNGDVTDAATGRKCTLDRGGILVGDPQASTVKALAWVYMF